MHPDESELLAYTDGDATPDLAAHVAACPSCATTAHAYAEAEAGLRRGLYRFDCPSPLTLGEYALELLVADARRDVAGHLVDCPDCQDELRTARAFLASDPFPVPNLGDRLRRLVATLVSPAPSPAFSLRGAADQATRTYRAGDVSVTLGPAEPEEDTPGLALAGLVARQNTPPHTLAGSEVRLLPRFGEPVISRVDDLGAVGFEGVAAGDYTLELWLPDVVVVVEHLRLA